MKNIRISSFIFIIMAVFFLINFVGYKVLSKHMITDHEKNKKILFYEIKMHTSSLLEGLFLEHKKQKEILKKKHQMVVEYLKTHDLDVELDEIYQKINAGHERKPYNIYITNKDLVINNSTHENDIGFNLTFAKEIFDRHHKEKIIGYSVPIRERTTKNFFTYTDSYLSKRGDDKHAVLQVSYAYKDTTEKFDALLKVILQFSMVDEVIAYSISNISGDVYEMIINDSGVSEYKPSLKRHMETKKKAFALEKKLAKNDLLMENFIEEETPYSLMYMRASYEFNKDVKLIYTIILDESEFYNKLKNLDYLMVLITILGFVGIIIIYIVRHKETWFSEQDKFIQSAMHEMKTPLSVITLNNELRTLEHGSDSYTEEIDTALKVLNNSYASMAFMVNKKKVTYDVKTLHLNEVLKERVAFFQSIADANEKNISTSIMGECRVEMSLDELIRLIDNNLSNAIKYSAPGSTIKVISYDNMISFNTVGKVIENKEKIFFQYVRENTTVGGYGLGLSIIKDIAVKYEIDISLQSDAERGTTFSYFFKCHTDDIQEE